MTRDPEVVEIPAVPLEPRKVISSVSRAAPGDEEAGVCSECGGRVYPGAWPFCPHGIDVNYSFRGNFR